MSRSRTLGIAGDAQQDPAVLREKTPVAHEMTINLCFQYKSPKATAERPFAV